MAQCSVEDCEKEATRKGWCITHYQRHYHYGRLHKIKGLVKGNCIVEGCDKPIKGHGYCVNHYALWKAHGKAEKLKREKTSHPFYHLWFERKQNKILCEAWLDFTTFVRDIGIKPEGEFFLVRLRNEPFSPTNFKWEEHLRKLPNESRSQWWARKRAARISANPSLESDRNIKRQYGLTREIYNEKLKVQNFVCAICENGELSIDGKSNTKRNLAVDHNHKTGKIRGLLCWRCNTTIGKINEDLDLIDKMKAYLIKHLT